MSLAILFHFLCAQYVLWALIYPSSGACDYSVELPHWLYCSWFDVCWSSGVVGLEWYRTKNNTTNVVIQQNNRKLLMMDILMSKEHVEHIRSEIK